MTGARRPDVDGAVEAGGEPNGPIDPLRDLLDPGDVTAALTAALVRGGTWSEVFAEHRTSSTARLDDGELEFRSDRDVGAGVRVGGRGPRGSASTTLLTRPSLLRAAEAAAAVRDGTGSRVAVRPLDRTTAPAVGRPPADVDRADVDTAVRADLLRRAADAAHGAGAAVRSVTVTLVEVVQHVLVATSDGLLARDTRVRTRMTCRVVARRSGRTATGFEGPGHGGGLELFDDRPPEGIGAEAAGRALRMLDAGPAPAGPMPVVLGPGGGGLLVHEACGHGLEADGVARGTSIYAGTQGRELADPHVTLVDDPTLPGGFGSYRVDDEGAPAAPTVLIDSGVQAAAMTDRSTADELGRPRTANGRRESAASAPLCRMSNTHLRPGPADPADLLGDVAHGVYVSRLSGGEVDIATGDFSFTASEAHLVERGALTMPLSGVTLLGKGPAALAGISAVADDLVFTQALCGNDGQWVPVSYGSPTLRIDGLVVTGVAS
ncbi:TldD/PmbA family protein [Geodermatophilus sp. CPCC 205506]|uniref:TldD/PmbA family protein n=1 Tax=Geodermatophilus sp. CPCC 205506 TaxID=2936596 RepID=UPI003EEC51FE